jgi:peptidoglycan-associated lipoprotein
LAFDTSGFLPNEYFDLYTTKDKFVKRVDSISNRRYHYKFLSVANSLFNDLVIDDSELRMNVKGRVYGDNKNNPLSNFKILLMNDKYETVDSAKTDMNGDFSFKYIPYNKQVLINDNNEKDILEALNNIMVFDNEDNLMKIVSTVKGKKFEYKLLNSSQNKMVELFSDDPWLTLLDKQIMAKKISGSTETIVESILFELSKSELLPQSMLTLDKVILAMKTNKNFNIELGAHSDSRGSDVQNLALSERRAISAKAYIVGKGIDAKRIVAKGYGESKLLNNCGNNVKCSEDEHAENRRIEFKISYR